MVNKLKKKRLEDLCCDGVVLDLYPSLDLLVAADPILSAVPVNLEEDNGYGKVEENADQEHQNTLDAVSKHVPSENKKINTDDTAIEPPARASSELSSNFDILEELSEESSVSQSSSKPVNYVEQINVTEAYRIPTEQDHYKVQPEITEQSSVISSNSRKRKQNNTTREIFIGEPGAAETMKPSQKRSKIETTSSPGRSQTSKQKQNAGSGRRENKWKADTIAIFEASSKIVSNIQNYLQPANFVNEDKNVKLLAAKYLSTLMKFDKWEPNERAKRRPYGDGENPNNVSQQKRRNYIETMIKRQEATDDKIVNFKKTCRNDYATSNDAGKAFIDQILAEIGEYKPQKPKERHNSTKYRAPDANELHNLCGLLFGDNAYQFHEPVLLFQDEIPLFDIEYLTVSNVDGDGHCGYRALSMLLSGTQDNHLAIRNFINMAIRDHDNRLPRFFYEHYGWNVKTEAAKQINVTNAADKTYWMGDEQIMALSLLIGINIAVYSQKEKTWRIFNKKTLDALRGNKDVNRTLDKKLPTLLLYHGNSHFEPVISVR